MSPSSMFHFLFSLGALHGRVPTDVLLSNSLHDCPSLRRCLMPGGLLSAISGILAGGILGFGAAEWFVLLNTFARSCSVVWCCCLCFCARSRNSLAQSCLPYRSCLVGFLFGLLVFWGLGWVLFLAVLLLFRGSFCGSLYPLGVQPSIGAT